ncbi:uncharacterized protein LOC123675905 [Harmonia axyridis]|uniref:uncharacterized protein LOC123675905 n=1 Tax=Harmonia axyridis TaxID=115357 RepID=UPI001E277E72|nr:uncharacterized protein LOC123675905 [Harmonia axyridis]
MAVSTAKSNDHEEKLGKELKSTVDSWKWKFNLPQKPNYNNVYYYKKSKKIFNAPCYDLDMDKLPDSYKGEFLQAKNILHQTDYRLKKAQEDARNKKQDLALQWKDLEDKELLLRSNFIQFSKFLSKNANKRNRAEQKFKEMKTMKVDCTEKISQMKIESEKIAELVENLKRKVAIHNIYEDYLNSVIITGGFRTIAHVLNRYILLDETKQTVGMHMEETSEEYHSRQTLYIRLLENWNIIYLSLSNELSEMRRKYDNAKNKTNTWEIVINDICNKYDSVARNISWSRMALRHLFDMAFFRVRRRRGRLVKKKRDDLGKMLRINETLKALEGIGWQMRKLYGQKQVDTSVDQVPQAYQAKERRASVKPTTSGMDNLMGKWKAKRKTVQIGEKEPLYESDDLAGFLKFAAEGPKSDDVCPIRLGPEKWRLAKVSNFEERYKTALQAIREEKIWENIKWLANDGMNRQSSTSFPNPKTHKSKWAAAAVAQKIVKDVSSDTHLPTPITNMGAIMTPSSDSAFMVLEDRYDSDLFDDANKDPATRRSQLKRLIERKFTLLVDSKEPCVKEREKSASILPTISTSQSKEKLVPQRRKQKHVKADLEKLPPIKRKVDRPIPGHFQKN